MVARGWYTELMEGLKGIGDLISSRPDYREGRPHITGTGVSVGRIGILWFEGRTPEETADDYDLTLPQVYAALACYHLNRELIDEDLRLQDEEYFRLAAAHTTRRVQPSLPNAG